MKMMNEEVKKMTREEYPCKHCKYGIYTIIDKKWWCDLYGMYAPQVKRTVKWYPEDNCTEMEEWKR